ncbi:MAG: hypothetical protein NTW94_07820 [Legionellales bacterium]|nr:hypothetical protein [Legionellales bacterium]
MPKLDTAIATLTKLLTHMEQQKAAAREARSQNHLALAHSLLTNEIAYATKIQASALEIRKKSKKVGPDGKIKPEFALVFAPLDSLQERVSLAIEALRRDLVEAQETLSPEPDLIPEFVRLPADISHAPPPEAQKTTPPAPEAVRPPSPVLPKMIPILESPEHAIHPPPPDPTNAVPPHAAPTTDAPKDVIKEPAKIRAVPSEKGAEISGQRADSNVTINAQTLPHPATEPHVEMELDMSKLDTAIVILTKLNGHIDQKKIEAIDAATGSNFVGAVKILDETITYAEAQKKLAITARKGSKKTDDDGKIKPEFSAQFTALDALQQVVEAGSAQLVKMRTFYNQSIKGEGATPAPRVNTPPVVRSAVAPVISIGTTPVEKAIPTSPDEIALAARRQAEIDRIERHIQPSPRIDVPRATVENPVTRPPIDEMEAEEKRHAEATEEHRKNALAEEQHHADILSRARAKPPIEPAPKTTPLTPAVSPREEVLPTTATHRDTLFGVALSRLKQLRKQPHRGVGGVPKELDDLIEFIEKANEEREPTAPLTDALQYTYKRLTNQMSSQLYRDRALLMQGQPSMKLKILGGLMLALSLALIACAIVFAPLILNIGAAIATGAATTILSGALITTGVAFFAKSAPTGLCQKMLNTDRIALEKDVIYPTGTSSV